MYCRINKNNPNAAQKKALRIEVQKEFNKLLDRYNRDANLMLLNVLHFQFGFGQKRLQQFLDAFTKMQAEQKERYELPLSDVPWLCEKKLEDSGINVKALLGETNEE